MTGTKGSYAYNFPFIVSNTTIIATTPVKRMFQQEQMVLKILSQWQELTMSKTTTTLFHSKGGGTLVYVIFNMLTRKNNNDQDNKQGCVIWKKVDYNQN